MATKTKTTAKRPSKKRTTKAAAPKAAPAKLAPKKAAAPVTLQMPAACICGATDFESISDVKPLERSIVGTVAGFDYRKVTWETKRCTCGQVQRVRIYHQNLR